jgi:hypothetical protein
MIVCPCEVEIIGVGSSMFIYGEGTAYVLLTASTGCEYVGVMHKCLQGTELHDLLSLSQLQILPRNICSLANINPYLLVNNIRFTLHLIKGVYELRILFLLRVESLVLTLFGFNSGWRVYACFFCYVN